MHFSKNGDSIDHIKHDNTSNGDLRRKQSNHKTDESMKIGQSAGFFVQLFFIRLGG